jgi:tetratricopeptide (TPR) repeat protein
VVNPPPTPTPRTPSARSARRERRWTWAIAGAVALILIAVIIGTRGMIQRVRNNSALRQGIAAYREGRNDVARADFLSASEQAPSDPMPHVYLSRLARETNSLTIANEEAVKAVRLGPNSGPALRELATTLYAMQNFNGARAFYTRAIAVDPADRTAQGYLGCALIQLGRIDEGRRWIRRAGSGTWSSCASDARSVAARGIP